MSIYYEDNMSSISKGGKDRKDSKERKKSKGNDNEHWPLGAIAQDCYVWLCNCSKHKDLHVGWVEF